MSKAYDNPKYYEIALWHNASKKKIIDFFKDAINEHSKTPVKEILELACGNSPLAIPFVNAGFRYRGLDLNKHMLNYSKERASQKKCSIETIQANMINFKLTKKTDLCYVLYNSIYKQSNEEFTQHLKSVSASLKNGGLYILHMVIDGDIADVHTKDRFSWTAKQGNITIHAKFKREIINYMEQLRKETLILNINDNGKKLKLQESSIEKMIFPQEFLTLLKSTNFEFINWYDGFNIHKPIHQKSRPAYVVCIIRKK